MNLPAFDLPIPPLPIDIPVLMHPPLVHFAIVLPIFILLLEIINIAMKRRALTVTTFVFFTLLIVIFAGAYLTGKNDGKEAWDLLGAAGQADLKEHKLIGTYLLLGSVVMVFLKLFDVAIRRWWMKLIYLLILIAFVGAVLFQGKEGGELVFEHGANVEKVKALDDQVFDLKEEISDMGDDEEEETSTPAASAPKAEEPKAEEPKAEEPKAEEPKAEEPKAEEPKAEEPKAEEPKAEEPKAEEPKAEESKSEEAPKSEVKEAVDAVTKTATDAAQSVKEAVKPATDAIKAATDK